jgi:hypothetical protein
VVVGAYARGARATIGGGRIGEDAFIGLGASVDHVAVAGAVVGMGAVVRGGCPTAPWSPASRRASGGHAAGRRVAEDFHGSIIAVSGTIRDALAAVDRGAAGIALAVDDPSGSGRGHRRRPPPGAAARESLDAPLGPVLNTGFVAVGAARRGPTRWTSWSPAASTPSRRRRRGAARSRSTCSTASSSRAVTTGR